MKIRQAVFPVAFLGLLLFVAGCDNTANTTPANSTQPQAEQVEVGAGMEQVAIFYGESNEAGLQKSVNAWLSQNNGKVEIVRILQSQSGRLDRYTTISIFYKKTK